MLQRRTRTRQVPKAQSTQPLSAPIANVRRQTYTTTLGLEVNLRPTGEGDIGEPHRIAPLWCPRVRAIFPQVERAPDRNAPPFGDFADLRSGKP